MSIEYVLWSFCSVAMITVKQKISTMLNTGSSFFGQSLVIKGYDGAICSYLPVFSVFFPKMSTILTNNRASTDL